MCAEGSVGLIRSRFSGGSISTLNITGCRPPAEKPLERRHGLESRGPVPVDRGHTRTPLIASNVWLKHLLGHRFALGLIRPGEA